MKLLTEIPVLYCRNLTDPNAAYERIGKVTVEIDVPKDFGLLETESLHSLPGMIHDRMFSPHTSLILGEPKDL